MQLALPKPIQALRSRIKIPGAVPPFNTPTYRVFSAIWIAAFLLALIGPAMGIYYRYTAPESNSQLVLGSRAGIAVSDQDATRIRFPIGPKSRADGIRPGDDIVEIYGLPVPAVMPVTEEALAQNANDPAYIAMGNLLFGTDDFEVPLTLRSPDGERRQVTVTTSEEHIDTAAREWGIAPDFLNFVDLLHVITYPFLLWASWILHRRNSRDAVSSILSLAILLTMAAEQPSATFLGYVGVPRPIHVALYDFGNISLLAGILLFPHGKLSGRLVLLLAALPILLVLHGDVYRAVFLGFMITAVLILIRCLRKTPPGDLQQQIKWALYGFSSYALFLSLSIVGDMVKTSAESFSLQFLVEMLSGLALGLAFLLLQMGLLIALLRYRLYDAEAIISRTASIAIITLFVGAGFAALMEGIITQMQSIYSGSQTTAAMVGAVMVTMLIQPMHAKVQAWAERRFHKNLLHLREGLPQAMRDLRDVADLNEFVQEVLERVNESVYSTRAAFVLGREVKQVSGISQAEVLRWLIAFQPQDEEESEAIECNTEDRTFPIRLRVEDGSKTFLAWVLIGPRPDGSIAGKDERDALAEVAVPLARSLRVVLKREEDQKELTQLLETYGSRIEHIERALKV